MAVASISPNPSEAEPTTPAADLLNLARSHNLDDRQRLMLGVVALCRTQAPTDDCAPALSDIFLRLARDAETHIRQTLAEQLSDAAWAPRPLLELLVRDEIEIARPLIARSPLLRDEDLMRILVEASVDHQVEVARRPNISGRVADAIIDAAQPAPMAALAGNSTAEISEPGLMRLIEQARRIAALRAPLSRHPRLNQRLAQQLYGLVGEALRSELQSRFTDAGANLPAAITAAIEAASDRPRAPAMNVLLVTSGHGQGDRDEMDRRLVDKLQASAQLKPGFLVRAVREQQLGLFEHGLSAMSGIPLARVRHAVRRPSADALYLACAAIGIDKAVFPTVLKGVRALTDGLPGDDDASDILLRSLSPVEAGYAFRLLMESGTGLPV